MDFTKALNMSDEIVVEQPKSLNSNPKPQDRDESNDSKKSNTRTVSMPQNNNVWDKRLGEWSLLEGNEVSTDCYPNLELLSLCNKIIIIRQYKLYNIINDGNRYLIKDNEGKNLFYGIEKSFGFLNKECCGGNRSFNLTLYDRYKTPVLHMERPLRFGSCGVFPFCLQQIIVKDKDKQLIGKVKEKYNPFGLKLEIEDEFNNTKMKVFGPNCSVSCIGDDVHFDFYHKDSYELKCGHICKLSELRAGGHIFNIKYLLDLHSKLKACIIGAMILIDYYYYEQPFHEHKYHRLSMSTSESLTPFPLSVDYNKKFSHQTNE